MKTTTKIEAPKRQKLARQPGTIPAKAKRLARWKYKLGQQAIKVCDRFLGRITLDQRTRDGLEAARLLASGGNSDTPPAQKWMHDSLFEMFDEWCESAEDAISAVGIPATDEGEEYYIESRSQVRAKFWLAFDLAWLELQRRDFLGQAVQDHFVELGAAIIREVGGVEWCEENVALDFLTEIVERRGPSLAGHPAASLRH